MKADLRKYTSLLLAAVKRIEVERPARDVQIFKLNLVELQISKKMIKNLVRFVK